MNKSGQPNRKGKAVIRISGKAKRSGDLQSRQKTKQNTVAFIRLPNVNIFVPLDFDSG